MNLLKQIRKGFAVVIIGAAITPTMSMGDDLRLQKDALKTIIDFSKLLCETPPLTGDMQKIVLTGKGEGQLKGLLQKITKLNIASAVKYEASSYEGVPQKDLAQLLEKSSECQQRVLGALKDKLIPTVGAVGHTKNHHTYEEILLKDQNPTQLIIDRVELWNFHDVEEPYVVLILKNPSTVTAKNVSVSFFSASGDSFNSKDPIVQRYHVNGRAIQAGQEGFFPIAPLSKYVSAIYPEEPSADIIEFLRPDEPKIPFSQQRKVCGGIKQNFSSCYYETHQRSTGVKITFRSIFDDKHTNHTQFFNVFQKGRPSVS